MTVSEVPKLFGRPMRLATGELAVPGQVTWFFQLQSKPVVRVVLATEGPRAGMFWSMLDELEIAPPVQTLRQALLEAEKAIVDIATGLALGSARKAAA